MQKYAGADAPIPSPWAKGLWKVYIHEEAHLRAVIRYVKENPLREGKGIQRWRFVTSFDAQAGGAQPGAREGAPDEPGG